MAPSSGVPLKNRSQRTTGQGGIATSRTPAGRDRWLVDKVPSPITMTCEHQRTFVRFQAVGSAK